MTSPDFAIIIPHYNDETRLKRCLDALHPQLDDRIDAIVVDNNSSFLPKVPPPFRLLTERKKGAAHARNRGVLETTAARFFFIDSDCLPEHDWVRTAIQVCEKADLVGGKVTVFDETAPPRSGAQAFEHVFAFDFKKYIEKMGFSGSGNLLTHRNVFEAIGGFREGLSEDYDWCQRARAAGFNLIYEPNLCVGHPSRNDWAALRGKWKRLTQESYGLRANDARARLLWTLRALAMPASIVAHTPKVLKTKTLSPLERSRALFTLARQRMVRMGWMLCQAIGKEI